jgi:hypothetical protein
LSTKRRNEELSLSNHNISSNGEWRETGKKGVKTSVVVIVALARSFDKVVEPTGILIKGNTKNGKIAFSSFLCPSTSAFASFLRLLAAGGWSVVARHGKKR